MALNLREQIDLYPAIIFDMDGTIMNSEIWHHQAWNQAIVEFGMPALTTAELYSLGGLPSHVITQRISERNPDVKFDQVALTQRKRDLYVDVFIKEVEPFPEICNVLKELSASGKRIAIATSSHHKESTWLLTRQGVLPYVHALITGDLVQRGKPNPDIYLLAAEKLQAPVEQCLVFEDTVVGMEGIKNAHMAAVKVFEGHYDCDHVITATEPWSQA